jgi:hypothetical protein
VPDSVGSAGHISPRTTNADPQARIGAQSLPGPPRDHPPCGPPLPEGTLFASLCLYHKAPTAATNWTRFALELAGQDQGPPGAPVEGCAGTGPALSSPDTAGVGPARQRRGRMAPRRWGARESPEAFAGTDGGRNGRGAGSPPRRREEYPLPPNKRPGPPLALVRAPGVCRRGISPK